MGYFKIFEYKNVGPTLWGISKNEHVINSKIEKQPKMKLSDFEAFQKDMAD